MLVTNERASCNWVDSLQVSSVQFSWCVRCEQAFRRPAVRLRSRSGSRRRGSRDASRVWPARAAHSWPATDCRCSLPAAAYSPALHSPTHSHHHRQGCKSFQSNRSMHHYECVVLCKDISLQRGRFCARSLSSYIPRSSEDSSLQVVRGRPGGRLQFSGGGSKMAWLASALSSWLKIGKFAAQSRQKTPNSWRFRGRDYSNTKQPNTCFGCRTKNKKLILV